MEGRSLRVPPHSYNFADAQERSAGYSQVQGYSYLFMQKCRRNHSKEGNEMRSVKWGKVMQVK